MAAGILTNALTEFEVAIDELASNFEFVRAASRLRPRLGGMLNWQNMDGDAKSLATTFLRQRTAQESLLYRGMVVSLAGAFEQFVRRILRDTVLAINASGVQYDDIAEVIRKHNIHKTGLALQTVFEPLDHLDLDYDLLSKNIGTCFIGAKGAVLNAEAFTIFLSIVSPEKLVDAVRRVGVELKWDALGKRQKLRSALEKNDTRETAKSLQEYLKRFGQTRNKIAHTGNSGIVVTEADFEQLLAFFRIFASALASVLETEILKVLSTQK